MIESSESKAKYRATMIAKFGSEEKWKAWLAENGLKGASAKVKKGYAVLGSEYASKAGLKSARIRRERKNAQNQTTRDSDTGD